MPVCELFPLLLGELGIQEGLLLIRYRWREKRRLVSGDYSVPRHVRLQKLLDAAFVSTLRDYSNAILTLVPCRRPRIEAVHPKQLLDWAVARGLKWVHLYDNQYCTFSGFSMTDERSVFCRFLCESVLAGGRTDQLRIAWKDWLVIRRGVYRHGWTLNRRDVSIRQGNVRFDLWGGTPGNSIFTPAALLSSTRTRLRIQTLGMERVTVRFSRQKCPLDDVNGVYPDRKETSALPV